MGFHKERHLIEQIATYQNLDGAADDAISIAKDKGAWFIVEFEEHREERLREIQQMIVTGSYPKKEYKPVKIQSEDKERDINPLHFYPWSIIFHAFKRVLNPIVDRVMIYDASAGVQGKGQVFAALRTQMMIRRYRFTHFSWSDYRKFYQSLPHDVVKDSLRWIIRDERVVKAIADTMLDYESGIEPVLLEEDAKKRKYCDWASDVPLARYEHRGITIGNCISQMIGGLVMCRLDHKIKEEYRLKGYHHHCDDKTMFHYSLDEAREFLRIYDAESNRMGLCLKASSFYAPLTNETEYIDGRRLDFVGYVFSTDNMRVRKRTKQKAARKLHSVRSRKRRRELLAAYWGIMKWGKCKNLWNVITNNDMSFASVGIKTEIVSYDENGKRMFNVPGEEARRIVDRPIVVYDFEDGLVIKGKSGRCAVVYREESDAEDVRKKFIISSKRAIGKLNAARQLEKSGRKDIFPRPTRLIRVQLDGGKSTYDFE